MSHRNRLSFYISNVLFFSLPNLSDAESSTPSRGDAIEKGDRIILQSDANIFYASSSDVGDDNKIKYCAPTRSKLTIESVPSSTTTTSASPAKIGDKPPTVTTSTNGATTTVKSTAAAAGDTTTTETRTIAAVVFDRVGGNVLGKLFGTPASTTCIDPSASASLGTAVKIGPTYFLNASDLNGLNVDRFGLTYGVVVVPNKVIVSTREFVSSSSVLPYIGWEQWGPSWAAAPVIAAGVGTAPNTSTSASTSSGTKATFTVATGIVGTIGTVFKIGLLAGVDTVGSKAGYKYQGKPWIGVSLGAGSQ